MTDSRPRLEPPPEVERHVMYGTWGQATGKRYCYDWCAHSGENYAEIRVENCPLCVHVRKMDEICATVIRMIHNNRDRPLDHEALVSHLEGIYSSSEIQQAIWHGVDSEDGGAILKFTNDWEVALA